MYGLSSFFVGEQRVAAEARADDAGHARRGGAPLPVPPRSPTRHATSRSSTASKIARSASWRPTISKGVWPRPAQHLNEEFGTLFDEFLRRRVDRLGEEPEDLEALVEAVTIYHMVIEGMLALTGQHFIIDYNEHVGTLPGFVRGFINVARDEHRHVAFGSRFLRDMAARDPRYGEAIQRTLVEIGPAADGVLRPKWAADIPDDEEIFGASVAQTRAFALKALDRRLKVIGLATAA